MMCQPPKSVNKQLIMFHVGVINSSVSDGCEDCEICDFAIFANFAKFINISIGTSINYKLDNRVDNRHFSGCTSYRVKNKRKYDT